MPNRVIRETILTSEKVNSLSWEEEIFFRRLLSIVDDFGRYDARAGVLRCALYPLKLDDMPNERVQACLDAVEAAELVSVYTVDGKPYLEVLKFNQYARAKKSRFPGPDDACSADAAHMQCTCTAHEVHVNSTRSADDAHMHSSGDADAVQTHCTCAPRARVTESESDIYKEERADNTTAIMRAKAESARADFRAWVGVLAPCHPALSKCRTLPDDVEAAAVAAFERLPQAVDFAPLLHAYMRDRMQVDSYRKAFFRPERGSLFFEAMERVLLSAERWQREKGWKPRQGGSKGKVDTLPTSAAKEATEAEQAAFLRHLHEIVDGEEGEQ